MYWPGLLKSDGVLEKLFSGSNQSFLCVPLQVGRGGKNGEDSTKSYASGKTLLCCKREGQKDVFRATEELSRAADASRIVSSRLHITRKSKHAYVLKGFIQGHKISIQLKDDDNVINVVWHVQGYEPQFYHVPAAKVQILLEICDQH